MANAVIDAIDVGHVCRGNVCKLDQEIWPCGTISQARRHQREVTTDRVQARRELATAVR